jgi:hypothetical protein
MTLMACLIDLIYKLGNPLISHQFSPVRINTLIYFHPNVAATTTTHACKKGRRCTAPVMSISTLPFMGFRMQGWIELTWHILWHVVYSAIGLA